MKPVPHAVVSARFAGLAFDGRVDRFCRLRQSPSVVVAALLLFTRLTLPLAGADDLGVRLEWTQTEDGIEVSWVSRSLTLTPPFVHYEFQVEQSADLAVWEAPVRPIPGGFLASELMERSLLLAPTETSSFIRIAYRLNLPGADLSGLDLSGADLTDADLSGANLSGAILDGAVLAGADLDGADLDGASLDGADVTGVDLNGLDLSQVDLSTVLGVPLLDHFTADPAAPAGEAFPSLPYHPDSVDLVADDPFVPGTVSTRNAMLMFTTNATIAQVNALLAAHGASIVASSPADATLPNATLMARFPTATAQELLALTVALDEEPIIEAAAPDIELGLTLITDDTAAAPSWIWDEAGIATGGNYGLEYARVPQMWNVLPALKKKGAPHIPTCIIDDYFLASHPDLAFAGIIANPIVSLGQVIEPSDHGSHVAGIAGAVHGANGGIDGVNPLALLSGFEFRAMRGYTLAQDLREALRQFPTTRVVNMSLGYNWYLATNALRPTISSPFTTAQLVQIEFVSKAYGILVAGVARASSSVLIVAAAGNDSGLVPARQASPMCAAALSLGVPNILIVGSHDMSGAPSSFSNPGAHVLAPGENILSAAADGSYTNLTGTSMATPFVTGLAGYLMATEPSLSPLQVKSLIGTIGVNADAFASLLSIDGLTGRDDVLRLLLDVDDTSLDGSLRVETPPATLTRDRSFEEVTGSDTIDLLDEVGDGVIDMADFRRWRDWLLFAIGNHQLNGSVDHLNLDSNANGTAHPHDDMLFHPRADFNGDGKVDLTGLDILPGGSLPRTDLQVLMFSDLWEDPDYTNATVLDELVDSADFHVSATNFLYKHTGIIDEVEVSVYDVATEQPVENGAAITFTPDSNEHVFTVPTGKDYFVASDPIPIGGGMNLFMRSIGDIGLSDAQRGADFAVDLAPWEMTATAELLNPQTNLVHSEALAKQVEAHITSAPTIPPSGPSAARESFGARAWATNSGTFYALARSESPPLPATNLNIGTTWTSAVRWQRSFIKDANKKDPKFLVKPMRLRLAGIGPDGTELQALAEISVEMRAYDISPAWQPVFFYRAEIVGKAASGGNPATFRIIEQVGDLPDQTLRLDGTFGAEYVQEKYVGRINLDEVIDGHSFEVRYRLYATATGPRGDGEALAYIGDPLDYGSGTRMVYGEFGDLPEVEAVTVDLEGHGIISYLSHTNFYYRLYRGADADVTSLPLAMKLGIGGLDSFVDQAPPPGATPDDYTLENQPMGQPLDLDGDGIDDVYELLRPAILDPLNPADAFLDPDNDGRSNLREYEDGTNPEVADEAPENPTLNFAGLVVPSYTGGDLVDLNQDGLLDSAVQNLTVAPGHLGGTFGDPVSSPLATMRTVGDALYVPLDGDDYPDAVLTDSLTNRVFVFRGVGDGTFVPLTNHPALSGSTVIVPCDLNHDDRIDVALMSRNGRGADLHLNNGDGTLAPFATVTTNAFGATQGLAMGDLNGDHQDDIVLGFVANLVVFLSQSDGTYGAGQPYPVGSEPESIVIAHLNGDGLPDVVAANHFSDTLSVLMGGPAGALLPAVSYDTAPEPVAVRLVDLNEDAIPDAVVSPSGGDYQAVHLGVGDGSFEPYYTVASAPNVTAVLDWDGDGHLDLVGTVSSSGGLVILGRGNGTFDTRLQIVPTDSDPTEVRAVDLDGNGQLELVALNCQANTTDLWEPVAVTGTSRLLNRIPVDPFITAFTQGDFNADGLPDLAVITQTNSFTAASSNQVVVLVNQGSWNFQDAGHYPMAVRPTMIVPADLDGDGALDLAVHIGGGTLNGGSQLVSLLGDGTGGFSAGSPVVVGDVVAFMQPADSDGDLASELVVRGSRAGANFLETYVVDGVGGWGLQQSIPLTRLPTALAVVAANDDLYPDLVMTRFEPSAGETTLLMLPGSPAGFGAETILVEAVPFTSFTGLADLNGDDTLDAIAFNTLFLAAADGGFLPAQAIYIGNLGVKGVADFNGDGRMDLQSALTVLLQQ